MAERRRAGRAVGLVLAALVLAGCGYSTRGNLPDHIKTVAVPIFKNRTLEAGVDTAITSGVVNAFSSGGRVKVVPLDEADAILQGEVVAYQGAVSDTIARGQGAVSQAAAEIGRKVVNLALDRF